MAFRKCPKCELNYIMDDQPYCVVCMKELKGLDHHDEDGELCPICGEREIAPGEEYCAECLIEMKKLDSKQAAKDDPTEDDPIEEEPETLEVIEEIEDLPLDEEEEAVPPFELENINEELGVADETLFEEEEPEDDEELEEQDEDENA